MNNSSRINFAVDRDFGKVMSKTFLFFQQNFRDLARITFLLMGPLVVVYAIYESLIMLAISDLQPNGTFSDMFSEIILMQLPVILAFLFANIFYQALIYSYLESYLEGTEKEIDNRTLFKRALMLLLPMTGITFILTLIAMISLITIIGPFYIMIAAAFSYIILLHEKRGVFASIGRSYDLISGYWWETFALLLVLGILGYVISGVMSIPQAIVDFLIEFNQLEDTYKSMATILHIIFGIVANLASFIASIFGIIGVSMQYFSLRERKEMPGLLERAATIGGHLTTMDQPAADDPIQDFPERFDR